jgi:integrase
VDPTDGWRNVKVETRPKLWLGPEEFNDLLNACDNARDRAVVALGLFTFCRGSEISLLKVSSIDFDNHRLRVFRPKTQEWDDLPISSELAVELHRWLDAYEREVGEPLQADWFLVPARSTLPMRYDPEKGKLQPTGEPARLKPTTVLGKPYDCVKRPLARIGYNDKGSGAHTLRRSGARALFDRLRTEGYDGALRRTSAMLGHKSVLMTERYLGLQLERLQRDELIAGLPLFPAMAPATIERLREVG